MSDAELKREIARRIADDFGGKASAFESRRSFRQNTKHKAAIDDALDDMEKSEMLGREWVETGGRKKCVFRLKEDGGTQGNGG